MVIILIFDRAADWKLDQPDWTGRVRVCAKGKECYIKIEDKNTGEYYSVYHPRDYAKYQQVSCTFIPKKIISLSSSFQHHVENNRLD